MHGPRLATALTWLTLAVAGTACASPGGEGSDTSDDESGTGDTQDTGPGVDLGMEPDMGVDPLVELEASLEAQRVAAEIPGLAACIVKHGEIAWCRGFGWADVEARRPMDEHTVFLVASLSKPVTATAVMQLWEDDLFELGDDVDAVAGFDIANPYFPDAPITYLQLLTHSSTVLDNYQDTPLAWDIFGEDSAVSLEDLVVLYFSVTGNWYFEDNFAMAVPGAVWNYTNMGMTLVAFLAQRLTGQPYADYVEESLFEPLGMAETSWCSPTSTRTS